MRRILDVRIVRWELKAAYVVAAYLAGSRSASLLRAVELPDVVVGVVTAVIVLRRSCSGRASSVGAARRSSRRDGGGG